MKIVFKNKKMQKLFEDYSELCKHYGNLQADEIIKRTNELLSSESLSDIYKLPQARLHPLTGNMKGLYSVDVKHPKRLLFAILDGDPNDPKTITRIMIEGIKDPH